MAESLRVRAAWAPCVEAGVLIYCMSTPAACSVVHKLVGFLDSPVALIYCLHISISDAHVIAIALLQASRGGKDPPRAGWTHEGEAWKTGSVKGEKTESAALLPSSLGPPGSPLLQRQRPSGVPGYYLLRIVKTFSTAGCLWPV